MYPVERNSYCLALKKKTTILDILTKIALVRDKNKNIDYNSRVWKRTVDSKSVIVISPAVTVIY